MCFDLLEIVTLTFLKTERQFETHPECFQCGNAAQTSALCQNVPVWDFTRPAGAEGVTSNKANGKDKVCLV